jgi:hypothetical protein
VADVPVFEELLGEARRPDLLAAVRAATAALGVLGLLVLPALTSADTVALWRDAARKWKEEAQDSESSAHRLGPDEAAAALAELCPPPEAALGYREWLAHRLGFRAS